MNLEEVRQRLNYCGSEERASCLISLAPEMTDADLKNVLIDYWSIMEAWGGSADRHEILNLCHRVGYFSDTKKKPHLDRSYPGYGIVKVFRGNIGEDPTEGFCWTASEATAEFFARSAFTPRGMFLGLGRDGQFGTLREGATPTVWQAWVRRDKILGYIVDRGESEVVVDPDDLIEWHMKSQAAVAKKDD